jgi:hypothetical protein
MFIGHYAVALGFGSMVYVGLGLWNSLWGTLLLELGLCRCPILPRVRPATG